MNMTVKPGSRTGTVYAPASKSMAHRYLICAALSRKSSLIYCDTISDDIEATADCLNALGAGIKIEGRRISVDPVKNCLQGENGCSSEAEEAQLYCRQSGSTLRFLLPLAGVLGRSAVFHMEGNLASRPMTAFTDELCAHGINIESTQDGIRCSGQLEPGAYSIPGNISSQFISGLLMSLPALKQDTSISISGELQSGDYVAMTEDAVRLAGIEFEKKGSVYSIPGGQTYSFPEEYTVEADWSGAAFPLCMGALSKKGIEVKGLKYDSSQGDRRIIDILKSFGADIRTGGDSAIVRKGRLSGITVDASDIPDLMPAVCAVASLAEGQTRIINAERLRMKETDRIKSITGMLSKLGADIQEGQDSIIINGSEFLKGGETDSFGDHRIAMAAAVASCGCISDVTVKEAECVSKSFPGFWEVFASLEI